MKRSASHIPVVLCLLVIAAVAILQWAVQSRDALPFVQKLEWMTFDWRVREALKHAAPAATNLGFVAITEESIDVVAGGDGDLGFEANLYWPRFIYGLLVQELDWQGAEAVAFDVLFIGDRSTNEVARSIDGNVITNEASVPLNSDHWLRLQLQGGNVILGAQTNSYPPESLRSPGWPLGDITAIKDDGTLRRAKAFEDYVIWHPLITKAARWNNGFTFDTNRLVFPTADDRKTEIPIDTNGKFNQAILFELLTAHLNRPLAADARIDPISQAFTRRRVWNLGLTLAAYHLKLKLDEARVEEGRRILVRGESGVERSIPIDREGRFYIDWRITNGSPLIKSESFDSLLLQNKDRAAGRTNEIKDRFKDKLVLVGSTASGNDLTDFGATPVEGHTFLTTSLWNIANSMLVGRFVQQSALWLNLCVIVLFGLSAAFLTWKSRTLAASLSVLVLAVAYIGIALYTYIHSRYWLPLVLPLAALLFTHFALLTYRVVFEQKERRHVRAVFARMVSDNIVTELLQAEKLSFDAARREVTVFFSDVRGFTALTDKSHARALEHVRQRNLSGPEAEACFDAQAQEVLATVNSYLSAIAEQVQAYEGTLDKYIGDCVMAFWGAPTPNPKHAAACVRTAIAAQRAIADLNARRAAENPLLEPLFMGAGINTGTVNVGLMGSIKNSTYTVFGREVNLASRLEGVSGRSRIVISEGTFRALQRDDPALAASCRELGPVKLKGFDESVKHYEVPWMETTASPTPESGDNGVASAPGDNK